MTISEYIKMHHHQIEKEEEQMQEQKPRIVKNQIFYFGLFSQNNF
jgi:hypothetical protein